jgi:hypothetical protein
VGGSWWEKHRGELTIPQGREESEDARSGTPRYARFMLGDQEAVVTEVTPFNLHGVTYYDLAVTFSDGTMQSARLGPEGVPEGLAVGDRVLVTMAANMVISVRRP